VSERLIPLEQREEQNVVSTMQAGAVVGGAAAMFTEVKTPRKSLGPTFWICVIWIAAIILLAIFANLLPLISPNAQNGTPNVGPNATNWLGTDDLGRDILSRVIYGARISLVAGFGSIAIALTLGGVTGMISGYRRGVVDTVVNASSYVLLAFPALVAVIAIVTFWGNELWKITIVIGIAAAPLVFRLVRAATLSYATRDFVTAARALGAKDTRILFREILPNILPAVISFALIGVATVIVLEGTLAFLGLSVPPPTASWGNMLNESRSYITGAQINLSLLLSPAIAMFTFLLALNLVGDRLRQHFDVTEVRL
jgi:peptide/nickel transport system permease protein